MGIRNKDGALYMATGIDNSGLYEGKREAMGIIKSLAGEVTSFDIFGGIGISAATAFAKAAKSSYEFEKEFRKNMLEVATISTQVTNDMTGFMNQVAAITQEIPIKAPEAAKALYQIVSAGHDGANGLKILEVSAKAAVGGLTETETAADAITTVLNAYKKSASEASSISDQLFTTVRLGKTTFGELGSSIAQVAPLAAAMGVSIEEVLAAVASLTKQGTPTAQAMTQIRAAIQGASKELGDTAFQGRSLQEALLLIEKRAGGSATKMKEMLGTDEGLAAALALTGKNASSAAKDLQDLQNSVGAAEAAFTKMQTETDNQMQLLANNVLNYLRPLGETVLKQVSDAAKAFNDAFKNNDIEGTISNMEIIVKNCMGAFLSYKTAILLVNAAQKAYVKQSAIARLATKKQITSTVLLTGALKKQVAAMLAAGKAAMTNPYVLAATAVTALGYALFKVATQASAAEKAMDAHNKRVAEMKKWSDDMRTETEEIVSALHDENKSYLQKVELYHRLNQIYPQELKNLSLQKFLLLDTAEANRMLAKSIDDRMLSQQRANVNNIEKEMLENSDRITKLERKNWMQRSFSETLELRRLRKRNEQLKIEHEKGVKIVVDGLKAQTKATAFAESQTTKEDKKITPSVSDEEIKQRKKLADQLLELQYQNQQSEIDAMKDGAEKKRKQIELDYDKQLSVIRTKEKEWKDAQGGNIKSDQQDQIDIAKKLAARKRAYSLSAVGEEENQQFKALLEQYEDYITKRKRIDEEYTRDRVKLEKGGASSDQIAELETQREEALSDIDEEFGTRQESFQEWADHVAELSIEKIRQLLMEAKMELQRQEILTPNDPKIAETRAKIKKMEDSLKKGNGNGVAPGKKTIKEWQDLHKTLGDVCGSFEEIGDSVGGVAGEIISTAGSIASSTLTMIDGIVMLATSSSQAMSGTANAAAAAIRTVETASVILAVVSAALQIATKIASLFRKKSSYEKYKETVEVYESYIEVLDKVIEKHLELADSLSGMNAVESYKEALKLTETASKAAREMGKMYLNSRERRHHTKGYKEVEDMTMQGWRDAANALGMSVREFQGLMGGRMTGIFDLSAEKLEELQSKAPLFFAQLDEDTQKYINQILEGSKQIEDVLAQQAENLTGISFDSFSDNILESLYDIESTAEDISNDMADSMRKALIKAMYVKNYEPLMRQWYDKWSEAMKDGDISEEEHNALNGLKETIVQGATNAAHAINEFWAIKNNDIDDRTASTSGIASISQDSADIIDGKMTTQLIFLDKTLNQVTSVNDQMRMLYDMQAQGWKDVADIKILIAKMSNSVNKITDLSGDLNELSAKIIQISKETSEGVKSINDSGIILKGR